MISIFFIEKVNKLLKSTNYYLYILQKRSTNYLKVLMVDCVFYKKRSSRELESINVDLCLKKIKRIMHKYVVDFLLLKKDQ